MDSNTIHQNTSTLINNSPTNENGAWSIQGHIKIFDPTTNEVFINKRNSFSI